MAEGEAGRIARVIDADSLALDTGLRVRLAEVETPAGRAKRIASFVEMLERGETVHLQGRKKG